MKFDLVCVLLTYFRKLKWEMTYFVIDKIRHTSPTSYLLVNKQNTNLKSLTTCQDEKSWLKIILINLLHCNKKHDRPYYANPPPHIVDNESLVPRHYLHSNFHHHINYFRAHLRGATDEKLAIIFQVEWLN